MIPTQKLLDNSNIERLGKRLRGTRAVATRWAKGSSSKRNTSNTMPSACVTRSFANRGSLSVLGSLRRAVKPSSLHVSNVPGCSGPFVAQTPSLPCVVAHSTAASKNTWSRRPLLPDYTFMSRTRGGRRPRVRTGVSPPSLRVTAMPSKQSNASHCRRDCWRMRLKDPQPEFPSNPVRS
jgi:hypothetical protein